MRIGIIVAAGVAVVALGVGYRYGDALWAGYGAPLWQKYAGGDPPPAQPAAATPSQPARVEGKPIDLLAVSGAKGMARKAGPVLIVVALVVVALVVWLIVR